MASVLRLPLLGRVARAVELLLIVAIPHGHRYRVVENQCPYQAQYQFQLAVDNVRGVCGEGKRRRMDDRFGLHCWTVAGGQTRTWTVTASYILNVAINCFDNWWLQLPTATVAAANLLPFDKLPIMAGDVR